MCKECNEVKHICNGDKMFYESFDELTDDLKEKFKVTTTTDNKKTYYMIMARAKKAYVDLINKLNMNGDTLLSDYIGNKDKILIKWGNCKHTVLISSDNYKHERGCAVCSGKQVLKGFNDVATTHPHLVKYFTNIEDAYTHTAHSNKKVSFKCPYCKNVKDARINEITRNGSLSCSLCSDGVSYPEKLIGNILKKLDLKWQKTQMGWSQGKEYDFYIELLNMIIEAHGIQHYIQTNRKNTRTLEEEQANDKLKERLAKENGIKYYYQIDCRYSTLEWCRPNIEKVLAKHFDLSILTDDDWLEADKNSQNSLLFEVCQYYNENLFSTHKIAEKLGLSQVTVATYLRRGAKLGLCDYNGKMGVIGVNVETGEQIRLNSAKDGEALGFNRKTISKCICGSLKTYKGYKWYRERDYLTKQNLSE